MLSHMDDQENTSAGGTISTHEMLWVWGAIFAGMCLRVAVPERMGVEHFDEGVYASNFWFDAENGYSYPARFLYAPPLLPAAIEWTLILASLMGIEPVGFVPMIPSLVAGIAMVPSIWWVCRRWFGPIAGLTAAWLIATSDFHVSYSRAALTDVPVCFLVLWAVYFIWMSLQGTADPLPSHQKNRGSKGKISAWRPRWVAILLAGGFTGLAWWTKYNGWLSLAIGFAGGAFWQFLLPTDQRRVRRVLLTLLLISGVAVIVWLPVLWGLQQHGGYAAVAANHRQYVVGIRGWLNSAGSQLNVVRIYENPLSAFYTTDQLTGGQPLSPVGTALGSIDNGQGKPATSLLRETIFPLVSLLVVPFGALVLSATASLKMSLNSQRGERMLPACLVLAWVAGLSVATPFYHPYPRLVMPWLCAIWLGLGIAFEKWLQSKPTGTSLNHSRPFSRPLAGLAISLMLISVVRQLTGSGFGWEDRTAIQSVSKVFASAARRETERQGFAKDEAIIYVIGEPAMVYGLKAEGLPAVGPVQDLGFMNLPVQRPTFVATSSRPTAMSEDVRAILTSSRFERIEGLTREQSSLVKLDSGFRNASAGQQRSTDFVLYRLIK